MKRVDRWFIHAVVLGTGLAFGIIFGIALADCPEERDTGVLPPASTTTTVSSSWFAQQGVDGLPFTTAEGSPAREDRAQRTLWVLDCDAGQRATAEGARYGPSPRSTDHEFETGWAMACPADGSKR